MTRDTVEPTAVIMTRVLCAPIRQDRRAIQTAEAGAIEVRLASRPSFRQQCRAVLENGLQRTVRFRHLGISPKREVFKLRSRLSPARREQHPMTVRSLEESILRSNKVVRKRLPSIAEEIVGEIVIYLQRIQITRQKLKSNASTEPPGLPRYMKVRHRPHFLRSKCSTNDAPTEKRIVRRPYHRIRTRHRIARWHPYRRVGAPRILSPRTETPHQPGQHVRSEGAPTIGIATLARYPGTVRAISGT